jgi:UDP-N-acetylglucosamine transferase subunit ALG13
MLGPGGMIFASVGSMLPFDRFVRGVDEWAAANPGTPVFAQIGDGEYQPKHCEWARIVPHADYRQRLIDCRLFVAHVGMGSILQALEIGKQMLLLPRHASLHEHTTEHQLHTADRFRNTAGLKIVDDLPSMHRAMTQMLEVPLTGSTSIEKFAPAGLTNKIGAYLTGAKR